MAGKKADQIDTKAKNTMMKNKPASIPEYPLAFELSHLGENYIKIDKRMKQWFPRGLVKTRCIKCGKPFTITVQKMMKDVEEDKIIDCQKCGYPVLYVSGKPSPVKATQEATHSYKHICGGQAYHPQTFRGAPVLSEEEQKAENKAIDAIPHPCNECRKVLYERAKGGKVEEIDSNEAASVHLCGECGKPLNQHRRKFIASEDKWVDICP